MAGGQRQQQRARRAAVLPLRPERAGNISDSSTYLSRLELPGRQVALVLGRGRGGPGVVSLRQRALHLRVDRRLAADDRLHRLHRAERLCSFRNAVCFELAGRDAYDATAAPRVVFERSSSGPDVVPWRHSCAVLETLLMFSGELPASPARFMCLQIDTVATIDVHESSSSVFHGRSSYRGRSALPVFPLGGAPQSIRTTH